MFLAYFRVTHRSPNSFGDLCFPLIGEGSPLEGLGNPGTRFGAERSTLVGPSDFLAELR
jgi:hypothetical protein